MKEVEKNLRVEQMKNLIQSISAYIEQYHGGSAELISFEGDVVKVKLGGACTGCSLSTSTLKGWIQGTVSQFFPEVSVEAAEE